MDQESIRSLYRRQVVPFLKYRLGSQLAHRLTTNVLRLPLPESGDGREAFRTLLRETLAYRIDQHAVLPLVFERAELLEFEGKFLATYTEGAAGEADPMERIFDELVAGSLEEILGRELVDSVRKVFLKAVAGVPELTTEIRFYIGMQAVYHYIPDVWSEIEFADKVKALSRLLPGDKKEAAGGAYRFDDLLEQVIISDLADILGRGHALETVIRAAQEKTGGVFYSEQDHFATFVNNLLEDEFLSRMFDAFWVEERRRKWIEEANRILST